MTSQAGSILQVFISLGRDVFAYKMPSGEIRPFYRSMSGTGGKVKGQIYPFDGFDQWGWLIKYSYYHDADDRLICPTDERFGYYGEDSCELRQAAQDIQECSREIRGCELQEISIEEANRRLRAHGAILDPEAV